MDANWSPIRLHNAGINIPRLFVKYIIGPSDYSIFLTDLDRVWLEKLDRREIFRRALNERASIDPTEDPDQLNILLERIKSALDGDEGTQLWLIREQNSDGLILQTVSKLPPPLGALHWPIQFSASSDQRTRDSLVLPLLCSAYTEKRNVKELIGVINEKDHVISKLLDKLESSGMDLTTVFPGISSLKGTRKTMNREQAARHVKALGAFDERQWRQAVGRVHLDNISLNEITQNVFSSEPQLDISDLEIPVGKREWWNQLSTSLDAITKDHATIASENEALMASTEEEGSDEFQKQATPPSLKKTKTSKPVSPGPTSRQLMDDTSEHQTNVDDDTTDDEDLDRVHGHSQSIHTQPAERLYNSHSIRTTHESHMLPEPTGYTTNSRRLGTIGNMHVKGVTGGAASTTSVASPTAPKRETVLMPPATPPPRPKGKLGVIGGHRQLAEDAPQTNPATPEKPSHILNTTMNPKRAELPDIDRHFTLQTEHSSADRAASYGDNSLRSYASTTQYTGTPPPPESSQERADRKREELKRQLEAKSQIPAKKKRRF